MLDKCRFPDLGPKYDAALRAATEFVLASYKPVGIVATGTIVRGNPDARSDLDIWVIHLEPMRQRVQRLFAGVPTEIFVNPPWVIEGYLESEQAQARPIAAHMLATGFVVYAVDPIVDELRRRARERLASPPTMSAEAVTYARYIAATLFEDALDLADRDPGAADAILALAVIEMLRYAFVARRSFIPRNKDLVSEVEALDHEIGALARRFFAGDSHATRLATATALADRVIATRGFFEWVSAAEPKPYAPKS